MNWSLARLGLRRALPAGLLVLGALLALLVVRAAWQPDAAEELALAGGADSAALARAGTWTALLALLVPWLVARAAAEPRHWRAGEIEWLARAARPRVAVVASIWIGLALAALLAVAAVGGAAELAAARRTAGPARQVVARFAAPDTLLAPGSAPLRVTFDPGFPPEGGATHVRLRLVFLGGGPAAELRAACAHPGQDPTWSSVLVSSGRVLEFGIDPSGGVHELWLEHAGGAGTLQMAGEGVELTRPLTLPAMASLLFGLRVGLALAALLALALGLGAWMGATTAFCSCAALVLAALLAEGAPTRWLPSAGLADARGLLGEGLAGPWPSARVWVGAGLTVLAGLLLAARGLASWRSAAR